jgi:hypothetical protein
MGGSAGAGTSLWLATHDDLADPAASDPVLRESTRLVCAVCNGTQATYDLTRWESFLGPVKPEFNTSEAEGALFYHLPSVADLATEKGKAVLQGVRHAALDLQGRSAAVSEQSQVVDDPAATAASGCTASITRVRSAKNAPPPACPCILVQDAPEPKPDAVQFLLQHLKVSR